MLIGISITLSLTLLSIPQLTHAALIDDIARGVHCTVRTLLGDTTCTIPLTTATTLNAFTQPQQSPPQPTTTTIIKPVERVVHTREVVREAPTLAYAQLATVLATIHDDVADIQVRTNDVIKEYQHTRFGDDALWRAVAHSQRIDQLSGDGLTISGLDCSTYTNGGTLTTDNNGTVVCAADDNTTVPNTDNQTIDTFTFSGDTISLSLEDDGEAVKTIDLSTYTNDTDINTQAALEAFITDVTNVFTDTDTIDISDNTNLAAGTGATLTGDTLSVDLGTSIANSELDNDTIDFDKIADALTVDATTTFDLDTNSADLNFDANTLFIDSSTNRVGVATSSPDVDLHVYDSSTHAELRIESSAAGGGTVPALSLKNPSTEWSLGLTSGNGLNIRENSDSYTSRLFIENGGNVGIGTTSPTTKLDIDTATASDVRIRNTGSAIAALYLDSNRTAVGEALGTLRFRWDGTDVADIIAYSDDDATNKDEADLVFRTSAGSITERMRITSGGNVGIGTTSPSDLLEVSGPAGAAGVIGVVTEELTVVDGDILGQIDFQAPLESSGTDAILVGASIWAEADATFDATVNATELVFATGASETATEKIRIDSSGNIGIGETNPTADVHVKGKAGVDVLQLIHTDSGGEDARLFLGESSLYGMTVEYDGAANMAYLGMNNNVAAGSDTYSKRMQMSLGGSEVAFMAGNVGIGDTTPDAALDVVGDIHYTGTITDVSDERLKNNITTLTYGLDELLQLQPISFTMLDNASSTPQLGFTAQNVNTLFPEAVSEIDDGFLGLDYTQLIAPLVNGVQEVWSVVQEHASVISRHTNEISELRAEVASLQAQLGAAIHISENSDTEDESTGEVTLTLIGNDPAEVPLSTEYSDLGVVAQNAQGEDISYTILVDDVEVSTVELDTSVHGTYTITYAVTIGEETVSITRTVIVGTGETVVEDPEEDIVDTEESVTEDEEETTHDPDNTEATHDDESGDTVEDSNEETLTDGEEIEDVDTEEAEAITDNSEHKEDENDSEEAQEE